MTVLGRMEKCTGSADGFSCERVGCEDANNMAAQIQTAALEAEGQDQPDMHGNTLARPAGKPICGKMCQEKLELSACWEQSAVCYR